MGELITIPYKPREAFLGYHNRTARFASIVAHRRAGKTVAAINDTIKRALIFDKHSDGRFAYVAPYRQQAKDVAWGYLKHYTARIPGIEVSESDLFVTLPGGSRVRLYGSDNYDAMRGIYLDGVILDEYSDHHPQAWREVIRPSLADRLGWAAFIGTSKGKNAFYNIHTAAESDSDWFAMKLKASETGIIPQTELTAMKAAMTANEYAREMECDFDAAVEGAYYADAMAKARSEGRFGRVAADPLMQYRAFWDIGISDNCVIWIAQFVGREIRVVDHYEVSGQPLASHLNWLRANGYENALCVLPHDGAQRDTVSAVRFEDHIAAAGFRTQLVKNQGKGAAMARIETARRLFDRVWIDEDKCWAGIAALSAYHEKRDEKRGIGLGPDHDDNSHSADAFGLMCVAYEEPREAKRDRPRVAVGWMN